MQYNGTVSRKAVRSGDSDVVNNEAIMVVMIEIISTKILCKKIVLTITYN
jgi:hypothetical protein